MQTPTHLVVSCLIWRNESTWLGASAVALGAVLPDLPMFGFYAYQKLADREEQEIWSTYYFDENWQLLFDSFNSIPIFVLLLIISYLCKIRWGILLAASALVHLICDLPVHHDDAHRHFLPLTNWRFSSPVSYWDPNHFGQIFIGFELVFAIAACIYGCFFGKHLPMRIIAFSTLAIYVLGIAFAISVWMNL